MNAEPPAAPSTQRRPYDPDYWSGRFPSEPYRDDGDRYEDFEPAYRFGYSLQGQIDDFDSWESECESLWDSAKEDSRLSWEKARRAIRTAWQHAEGRTQSVVETVLRRGEERMLEVFHRWENHVRRHPSEYVLGAAATGYLANRLPLRPMLLTGIGLASAAAPAALVFLGLWKAAERLLGPSGNRASLAPYRPAEDPFEPEPEPSRVIVTD
jgi:hypothetical protein